MKVSFEIPPPLDEQLRRTLPNLDEAAKEGFLVNLYRQGRLFHSDLAAALGVSRDEADGILKQHGVESDLTPEELDSQIDDVSRILNK